jgi:hypothetical protein
LLDNIAGLQITVVIAKLGSNIFRLIRQALLKSALIQPNDPSPKSSKYWQADEGMIPQWRDSPSVIGVPATRHIIVLFEQDRADQADDGVVFGGDGRRFQHAAPSATGQPNSRIPPLTPAVLRLSEVVATFCAFVVWYVVPGTS